MYGKGKLISDNRYESESGAPLYFYDKSSIDREFGPYGLIECMPIDGPALATVVCKKM